MRRFWSRLTNCSLALLTRAQLSVHLLGELRIRDVDGCRLAQLVEQRPVLRNIKLLADLLCHRLERRLGGRTAVFDLDDVPAELGLHRIGDLTNLHGKHGIAERLHHDAALEIAEIATGLGGIGLDRLGPGQRHEIGTGVEFGLDCLGVLLRAHQNVTRVDFVFLGDSGDLLVVLGLDGFGRDRVADGGLGIDAAKRPVGEILEAKLEQLVVPGAVLVAGLRHELEIDHLRQQDRADLVGRDLVEVGADILGGEGQVGLGDRLAADRRNNRARTRLFGRCGRILRQRSGRAEGQKQRKG